MRIVVNDIAASKGGAMSVLLEFYNYIKSTDSKNEWIFLLGDKYLEETNNIKIKLFPKVKNNRFIKIFFDLFFGRFFINRLKPDKVISLQNIVTFGVMAEQFVFVQQSIPFQTIKNFSLFNKAERSVAIVQKLIGCMIIKSVKYADAVFVQTNSFKQAVCKKTGIPETKVEVVFPKLTNLDKNANCKNNRFFYPTSSMIYKNNELIVKACDILNAKGYNDFSVKLTLPNNMIKHKNIECVGYLNRDTLLDEYAKSVLLFPSYIETVGLPLLEAKMVGTIIFASNLDYSHEVLGDYPNAHYFDYNNSEELAELMEACVNNKIVLKPSNVLIEEKNSWDLIYYRLAKS